MSEKMEAVATSEAPAALGAYSQAVKANGFVFVSGQLGIDPATGELAGETAGEQAAQALKNIKHILDTAGTGIEHVCRATIYLKNVEDFKEVDARYAEVFILGFTAEFRDNLGFLSGVHQIDQVLPPVYFDRRDERVGHGNE